MPYEDAAVRSALARLLEDPALRARLGEEAKSVARDWSWPRILDIQEDLYSRVQVGTKVVVLPMSGARAATDTPVTPTTARRAAAPVNGIY